MIAEIKKPLIENFQILVKKETLKESIYSAMSKEIATHFAMLSAEKEDVSEIKKEIRKITDMMHYFEEIQKQTVSEKDKLNEDGNEKFAARTKSEWMEELSILTRLIEIRKNIVQFGGLPSLNDNQTTVIYKLIDEVIKNLRVLEQRAKIHKILFSEETNQAIKSMKKVGR